MKYGKQNRTERVTEYTFLSVILRQNCSWTLQRKSLRSIGILSKRVCFGPQNSSYLVLFTYPSIH